MRESDGPKPIGRNGSVACVLLLGCVGPVARRSIRWPYKILVEMTLAQPIHSIVQLDRGRPVEAPPSIHTMAATKKAKAGAGVGKGKGEKKVSPSNPFGSTPALN